MAVADQRSEALAHRQGRAGRGIWLRRAVRAGSPPRGEARPGTADLPVCTSRPAGAGRCLMDRSWARSPGLDHMPRVGLAIAAVLEQPLLLQLVKDAADLFGGAPYLTANL